MKLNTIIKKNQGLKNKIQKLHQEGANLKVSQKTKVNLSNNLDTILKDKNSEIKVDKNSILKKSGLGNINVADNYELESNTKRHEIKVGDNTKLKESSCAVTELSFINDSAIKGGYRVVSTISERDAIDCCYRKLGMVVVVVGTDYSFKEYTIRQSNVCNNDNWEELVVLDGDVILEDNYDELGEDVTTQQELNQLFKDILLSISTNTGGGDKNYVHDQIEPSKIWVINHTLNKKVSVTITDTAGTVVEGKVTVNNGSKVTVEFNFPFNGEAILN